MAERQDTGAVRDTGVWLFAYGSIMWNPGFDFAESAPALLRGWHRAFCI
jgi:cation transport protein ChaC